MNWVIAFFFFQNGMTALYEIYVNLSFSQESNGVYINEYYIIICTMAFAEVIKIKYFSKIFTNISYPFSFVDSFMCCTFAAYLIFCDFINFYQLQIF